MRMLLVSVLKKVLRNRCKTFLLGEGKVERYTFFEFKGFASLYMHCIETECQDRLHTHAFNGIGWTISGGYDEEVQELIGAGKRHINHVGVGVRFLPRSLNHRLMHAKPDTPNW